MISIVTNVKVKGIKYQVAVGGEIPAETAAQKIKAAIAELKK